MNLAAQGLATPERCPKVGAVSGSALRFAKKLLAWVARPGQYVPKASRRARRLEV
jgi:hypothetical protein